MTDTPRADYGPNRSAPHAIEAEEAVLGCVLINPEAYFEVAPILHPDDFYLHKHRWIWEAFVGLHDQRLPIDIITVAEELERHNQLGEVGGSAYLTRLINSVPTSIHAEAYGRLVEQEAMRRRLLEAATEVAKLAYEEGRDISQVINDAEAAIFAVSERRLNKELAPIKEAISQYYDRIKYLFEHQDEMLGVPTGFIDLDKLLGGLQQSDLLIIAGRPGSGKCLAADSEIVLADGRLQTIEEVYRQQSATLLTLRDDFRLALTQPGGYLDDGLRPTFRVTTALGRSVTTTASHPFLTASGWKPLAELKVDDRIAVPRRIPIFGERELRPCEIILLAYLIGDGCLVHRSPEFVVGKPALKTDFEQAALEFGGLRTTYHEPHNRTPVLMVSNAAGLKGRGIRNPLTDWLRALGIFGKNSHDKFIPECVFQLPRPQLALFLNRLFATDGWASAARPEIGYASVSERLMRQLQHLLLRFGVISILRKKHVKYKDTRRPAWQLQIYDAASLQVFAGEIGIYGKEAQVQAIVEKLGQRRANTNTDTVPMEVWDQLQAARGQESWASLAHRAGIQTAHSKTNIHVGQRTLSRGRLGQLAEALDSTPLKALAASDVFWDRIVAIEPAGTRQVYDLTIPDTHNFVANDICVHNTGLMLNVAKNAALTYRKHVAVFSLEMSNDQLVQRLISQETGIDSQRLRLADIHDHEWPLFVQAANVLSDAPIFLDDTPALTPNQLRSKCRRLDQEYGLDLIIVDYLQLMQGEGRNENRVQEVSTISRSLKQLARELNVPVLAGAQLSRAVEQRTDKRPVLSDLRESGCLTGDTLVALASGKRQPIRELVGQQPEVITLDGWKLTTAPASRVWLTGHRPVFKLTTRMGRVIRATGNHPFRVLDGWQALEALTVGDRIAVPRHYPEPTADVRWPDDRLILLAHLIGDGCYASRNPLHYTSASEANLSAVTEAVESAFGIKPKRVRQENWFHLYLSAGANKWHPNPVRLWLRELGIDGQRSPEKFIPAPIFTLPNDQVALFLRHLWSTDGSIYLRKTTHGQTGTIYYASTSERLAYDVQHLLGRLGIPSRVMVARKLGYRPGYQVHVTGQVDQMAFARLIGGHGERGAALQHLVGFMETVKSNPNRDTIPREVWGQVKSRMATLGISQRKMAAMRGTAYGGDAHFGFAPTRTTLLNYAGLLEDTSLAEVAQAEVYWDTIASIEPDGEADVFDMTVPGTHNFVANGIVVHNSLEQDSDIVMFIHRPDMYEKAETRTNIAEIIVAKHRNGPTADVQLVFRGALTKFENAETRHVDLTHV